MKKYIQKSLMLSAIIWIVVTLVSFLAQVELSTITSCGLYQLLSINIPLKVTSPLPGTAAISIY